VLQVQCYECKRFGHTRTECATFQKNQKKSLTDMWPDENISDKDSEHEPSKRVAALTGRVFSDTDSCDEELAYADLAASYKDLYFRSAEICKQLGEQKKIHSQLLTERSNHLTKILELSNDVSLLNSQLYQIKKQTEIVLNDTTIPEEAT